MKKKVNLNDSYVTKMIVIRVIGLGVMILISILLNSCAVEDHNCRDWRVYHQTNGPIH
jgi:hypothetical protein